MKLGYLNRGDIAQLLAVLMVFALVFPTAAINFALLLLLVGYVIQGDFARKWAKIRAEPVAMASLLLLGLFIFSLAYTPLNLADALLYLNKYRELLLLPIILSFVESERWRRVAYFAFLVALSLMICISYAKYFGWLPPGKREQQFVPLTGHITFSFFLSYGIYLMLHQAIRSRLWKHRMLWILLAMVSAFDLLFLIVGRTGHVVLVALLVLLIVQYRDHVWIRKFWLLMLFGLAAAMVIVKLTSPAMHSREVDIQRFEKAPESSSIGQRLIFWETSFDVIKDAPWIGSGVGSYKLSYEKHNREYPDLHSDNPHNEYLLIASQLGLLGVAAFIWLLVALFRRSASLPPAYRFAAQGLVVAMAVGCLFNSFLRDHAEGHFFAVWAGLLFAPVRAVDET